VPLRTNEFRYVLGVVAQRAGRPAEAAGLFRKALEQDIGLYTAHARLADLAEEQGDVATAVAERRAAAQVNPDDASLLLDLGRTLVRAGRADEAAAAFREAADLHPRDARALYYLGVLYQRLNRPTDAADVLQRFLAMAPSRYGPQIADATQRLATLR
jgi:superkiller protein 3